MEGGTDVMLYCRLLFPLVGSVPALSNLTKPGVPGAEGFDFLFYYGYY
jgi:hypothetical protein